VRDLPFTVTNTGRGVGTLVPGAALLVFEVERVHDGRSAVVSRGTVAVVLAAAAGGVSQVIVTPSNFAFSAPGGTLQLTGVVLPSSAPQGIQWTSSNVAVASVTSTGFVTAWAPGATLMTATSAADPSKLATALISVATQPVFGNGVNVSPGSWNAVPGMRLLFAAQVVNGPPAILFASSSPVVVAVNSNGLATAVSRGNANITARSVADPSQSADAPVTVFDFNFRAPVSPTLVSTGAVSPPANPLSVNIQAQACQAMTVLSQPFPRIDFEALTGTTWTTIGSAAFPSFVVDNGIERCWVFATTWTPGSAFGNGQQLVRAAAYDAFGGRSTTASNPWITTTTP
jgi:Bacterial Ig-like domain (group 2)